MKSTALEAKNAHEVTIRPSVVTSRPVLPSGNWRHEQQQATQRVGQSVRWRR